MIGVSNDHGFLQVYTVENMYVTADFLLKQANVSLVINVKHFYL